MIPEVRLQGFILAGGMSRRMGRDKALLEYQGKPLIEHVAGVLATVAKPITVIGCPERYAHLGLPVIADRRPGLGPLAGIEAALLASDTERNLIVACDMPGLPTELLQRLATRNADCVLPKTPDGQVHPLCAIWNTRLLPAVQRALDEGRLRVTEALQDAEIAEVDVPSLNNANTPQEWLTIAR